jgi:hypothetical protein
VADRERSALRLDVIGLFAAGLINTVLALLDAALVLGPGTTARQPELLLRAEWIVNHPLRWQGGWLFWFAVTLSFSWSYLALGRHLRAGRAWVRLAVALALIAAAVDIVGILVNLTALPELARGVAGGGVATDGLFAAFEGLAYGLTNVAAFGLYSLAGLLLLPALFAEAAYPRWLARLGAVEWIVAALATALLVMAPALATGPLLLSFALFAPWVWGSGVWLLRTGGAAQDRPSTPGET